MATLVFLEHHDHELQPPPPRGDSVRIDGDASAPQKIVDYLAERKLI